MALVLACFATIQLASDSLYAQGASPGAFPTWIPERFGLAVYGALDRVAPARYVESALARAALADGDLGAAERHALKLPPDSVRNGLLAQVAAARGENVLAYEYAFAAPDTQSVQDAIERVRAKDPVAAYGLEERFRDRLAALETHPDAVARAWWMLGEIAASMPGAWQTRAYVDYATAARLAPLDVENVLSAANEAVTLSRWSDAQRWYARALDVNPASADAIAGLGLVAIARHDRVAAQARLRAALAIDPSSKIAATLAAELRVRP